MNTAVNIPHNLTDAKGYHSPDCVDLDNCPKCKAYVESIKIDSSVFERLLKDLEDKFGGGRE